MPTEPDWQPGFRLFLEEKVLPGVSGVARFVLGPELSLQSDGPTRWLHAPDAAVLWVGCYSNDLLARGRQPYDQSSPAAYIPLPLSAMDEFGLPSGRLFIQRQPARERRLHHPVRNEGGSHHAARLVEQSTQAQSEVERLLSSVGVPSEQASHYARQVLLRLLADHAGAVRRTERPGAAAPSP